MLSCKFRDSGRVGQEIDFVAAVLLQRLLGIRSRLHERLNLGLSQGVEFSAFDVLLRVSGVALLEVGRACRHDFCGETAKKAQFSSLNPQRLTLQPEYWGLLRQGSKA